MTQVYSRQLGKIIDVDETQYQQILQQAGSQPQDLPMTGSGTMVDQTAGMEEDIVPQDVSQATQTTKPVNPMGLSLDDLYSAKSRAQAAGDKKYVSYYQGLIDTEEAYGGTPIERQKGKEGDEVTRALEIALDLLEKQFFGLEGERTIAAGREGFGGRIPGHLKKLQAKHAPSEETEDIRAFQRVQEAIGATLAKAGFDAGNIAIVEQLLAREQLGQVVDTPREAVRAFASVRERYGVPMSERLEKAAAAQGIEGDIATGESGIERGVAEMATEPKGEFEDRGFIERLIGTEGTMSYLQEAPGIALEGVKATGQNIGDLLSGDLESAIARSEEFRPQVERVEELDEAAREEIATKISTVTGIAALKSYLGPKLAGFFKGKSPELVKQTLEQGTKQVLKGKEIRDVAIKEAQNAGSKVNGTKVFSAIKQWGDDAIANATPAEEKVIKALVKKAQKFYKGKILNPTTAKKRWDTAVQGFKDSGKIGDSVKSGYHRAIRDGVRQQLDDITNGAFEEGTRLIHEGLNADKLLSGISKSLQRKDIIESLGPSAFSKLIQGTAKTGAQGLGLYAVARALGLQFPGAAYPQE